MASVDIEEDLLHKYILDIEKYSGTTCEPSDESEAPGWLDSVTCEEKWKKLIDLSFDRESVKEFLVTVNGNNSEQEKYFQFGIACLIRFIQSNFTGPKLPSKLTEFLNKETFKQIDCAKLLLTEGGKEINVNITYLPLLFAADLIIDNCVISKTVNTWWKLRLMFVHCKLFGPDYCKSLQQTVKDLCKEMDTSTIEGRTRALFDIEVAQIFLLFKDLSEAKDHLTSASNILGLKYQLVGKMAKRSKFQERALAQLVAEISLEEKSGIDRPEVANHYVPVNVLLKDDQRLDTPEFVEPQENTVLPETEQKLCIAIINEMMITKPIDELNNEEIRPFVDIILDQKNTWGTRIAAVLLRCRLEERAKKNIERCFTQCEVIVSSFRSDTPNYLHRVMDVFGCGLGPIWGIQEKFARLLFNAGLIKHSLQIFLEIQAWDDVIECYNILQMKHKAAEIIQQQLKEKPSVNLWCLLGDATNDETCYEKAWLMSEESSSQAKRHWGNYYFNKKNYKKCIPHFEESVKINPYQEAILFRLGFAAIQVENWPLAVDAYRLYTSLEQDSFKAWNNLALAYMNLGHKRHAHHALLEAIKCNYDQWQVWESLLLTSCDISHFSDTIRSYHRLLDLQGKYLDVGVLSFLVSKVCNGHNDAEGKPSSYLIPKLRELLGRVTSIHPGNGVIWELYAEFTEDYQVKLQRLMRAYAQYTNSGNWVKDQKYCRLVLSVCKKLGELVMEPKIDAKDNIVNSVRMNLNCVVEAMKKQLWNELEQPVNDVAALLEKIKEKQMTTDESKT